MINHIWSVLCSDSVTDIDSNNISLHNVLEQLDIHGKPRPDGFARRPLEIVFLWERYPYEAPTNGTTRLVVQKPDGTSLGVFEVNVELTTTPRCRSRIKLNGLPVDGPGRYLFCISIREHDGEWVDIASVPLVVQFSPGEDETEPPQEAH